MSADLSLTCNETEHQSLVRKQGAPAIRSLTLVSRFLQWNATLSQLCRSSPTGTAPRSNILMMVFSISPTCPTTCAPQSQQKSYSGVGRSTVLAQPLQDRKLHNMAECHPLSSHSHIPLQRAQLICLVLFKAAPAAPFLLRLTPSKSNTVCS